MIIGIQDEILRLHAMGLLEPLLRDKTTKANILWATDAYQALGPGYERSKEIHAALITGENSGVIKNRARKALEQQSARTRQHAEVFTPLWICNKMNDHADEVWFGRADVFSKGGEVTAHVDFADKKGRKIPAWQRYVDARRLEITCGEAPYLVSRYDVSTGESIPVEHRCGILDRKLRVVNENAATETEWLQWALRAFQATYGYEFQGDNLLIARVNMLMTFEEYLLARWHRRPRKREYQSVSNVIVWNIWQMDGLTGAIPYSKTGEEYSQLSMYGPAEEPAATQPHCLIHNWRNGRTNEFLQLPIIGGRNPMKFDYVIGNDGDVFVINEKAA